jgi:pimeloyl-ACP methyl ester carboxylesterase
VIDENRIRVSIFEKEKPNESQRKVRDRYLAFLKRWPVPNQQIRLATSQGETFVVASGPEGAPPLLLFHGSAGNSAMWMGDVPTFASAFRVYSIDMIGEAGLSAPSRPALGSDAVGSKNSSNTVPACWNMNS